MYKSFYWKALPPYFTSDSAERLIFKPETDTHATEEQLRELLADAKFYTDPSGPDQCPPGLKTSAKAVIKAIARMGIE